MNIRLLTAEEAVAILVTGDHVEAMDGSVALDVAIIDAIRQGRLLAGIREDDRLVFFKPPSGNN